MSAAALFTAGSGDFHIPITVRLADIPKGQQLAAWRVFSAIIDFLRKGRTELGERYTDRLLHQSPWLKDYSLRFIQKGLRTLSELGLIRRVRQYGRRIITVLGRLRGRQPKHERKARDPPAQKAQPEGEPIPNVGRILPMTAEQQAAHEVNLARAEAEAPPPTAEETAQAAALFQFLRDRREHSATSPASPAERAAQAERRRAEQLAELARRREGSTQAESSDPHPRK
jgi:hypothetical protein